MDDRERLILGSTESLGLLKKGDLGTIVSCWILDLRVHSECQEASRGVPATQCASLLTHYPDAQVWGQRCDEGPETP